MPAWPPPTMRTSGSRSPNELDACRCSASRARRNRGRGIGLLNSRARASQILSKSSVVEMVQACARPPATGEASNRSAPMPGPLTVAKLKIASITSRPATSALRGVERFYVDAEVAGANLAGLPEQFRRQLLDVAYGGELPGQAEQISPVAVGDKEFRQRARRAVTQRRAKGAHPRLRDVVGGRAQSVQHGCLERFSRRHLTIQLRGVQRHASRPIGTY